MPEIVFRWNDPPVEADERELAKALGYLLQFHRQDQFVVAGISRYPEFSGYPDPGCAEIDRCFVEMVLGWDSEYPHFSAQFLSGGYCQIARDCCEDAMVNWEEGIRRLLVELRGIVNLDDDRTRINALLAFVAKTDTPQARRSHLPGEAGRRKKFTRRSSVPDWMP